MENRGTAKGFLIGVLAGGAAGSIVALLYAPKSGKELRKDIGKKKDKMMKEGERYIETAKTKASEIITDSRKKAEGIIDDAKRKAVRLKDDASGFISAGKERISEEGNRIKDAVRSGLDAYKEERKAHSR